MRTLLRSAVLSFGLLVIAAPGCPILGGLVAPTQVQIVAAAADAVDAANQLGEIVLGLSAGAHKLHLAHVVSREIDDAVQVAAIQFANAKDKGVTAMGQATNAAQLVAAAAPLVGQASAIVTAMKTVNTTGLTGAASVVADNIPSLLDRAKKMITKLGGKA
jgi:hypothetical protein